MKTITTLPLAKIYADFAQNPIITKWHGRFSQDLSFVSYCLKPKQLLGLLISEALPDKRLDILDLWVNSSFRKQGLASNLLEYVAKYGRMAKMSTISLEVAANNHKAIALYKKHGFSEIGIRKNYYQLDGQWVDALVFDLAL